MFDPTTRQTDGHGLNLMYTFHLLKTNKIQKKIVYKDMMLFVISPVQSIVSTFFFLKKRDGKLKKIC